MKAVIQRVESAAVRVDGKTVGSCGKGYMILFGAALGDTEAETELLAKKTANLRVFCDENGKMNKSILDIDGEVLAVSQFTLCADVKKGNRPSYIRAAGHDIAIPLYEYFTQTLSGLLLQPVGTGEFGADMQVELLNDGPVTICMDTKNKE